jgi:hypothetical protein
VTCFLQLPRVFILKFKLKLQTRYDDFCTCM